MVASGVAKQWRLSWIDATQISSVAFVLQARIATDSNDALPCAP
jgi:hypothetical protein